MSYETKNPKGAKELLDSGEGWVYLDVRTVEEYEQGHVPGAYNVPYAFRTPAGMEPNPEFADVVARLFDSAARLVLGCAAGGRSARACELLLERGFRHMVNMHGGFSGARDPLGQVSEPGWVACGFEVEARPAAGRTWRELREKD